MMSAHKSKWCVAKGCSNNYTTEKRHFFSFPKEHDRWLQWIRICQRLDLEVMGPEYAHRNYKLCHLHFEEKWYKISKKRAYLYPDAVPTTFLGTNITPMTASDVENVTNRNEEECQQEETNSDVQPAETSAILSTDIDAQIAKLDVQPAETSVLSTDIDAQIAKPSTSSSMDSTVIETPRKKKLKGRNIKLKAENRMLRERIRRLQKKMERMENTWKNKEDSKEHETLRQLGCV